IDRDESYDAPAPTQTSTDLAEFLEFFNEPSNKKKYMFNTNLERELLFYFDKISEEDKKEIIEFTKIKAKKPFH
ncbi:MAG: transcriptional regulator, partial [Roseburia sp.]|nr:transcriptional regulator [Roseburia sp.]